MKKLIGWSTTPTLLLVGFAHGQEAPKDLTLSLEDCVKIALEKSNSVVQGKLLRDLQDVGVDQAKAAFLPTLSSGWGNSNTINGPRNASFLDESTGTIVQSVGESTVSGGQSVSANLNMSLFNASDFANLAAARKNYRAQELDLTAREHTAVFLAKRDYYSLLQTMSLLEVQREQVHVSEESLRRAETLNEIGSSPISQVFSAKAVLESERATLILRENAVEIARSQLSFTLGMTPDTRIIPIEVEISVDPVPLSYTKAYEIATRRPALVSDRYQMLGAKDNLRAQRYRQYVPSVRLSGSYGWNLSDGEDFAGFEDLFLRNYRYTVSVNVSVPILNMGTTTGVKRQKIQYLQQLETYEQAKRDLGLDVRSTLLRLEQLRRTVDANEASVVAQEQDFRLQDEAYNFGAGTFLDRQQAQLRLFNARSALVRARYDYQIQIATLEQLIGMPLAEALAQ